MSGPALFIAHHLIMLLGYRQTLRSLFTFTSVQARRARNEVVQGQPFSRRAGQPFLLMEHVLQSIASLCGLKEVSLINEI